MSGLPRPIIVALDVPHKSAALALAERLDPALCRVKVGKELFTAAGPAVIEALQRQGHEVFLDLKFHDIPNTVAGAVRAASALGVWMLNVHASGGRAMLRAAHEAARAAAHPPLLIAVTVLTSLGDPDLAQLGVSDNAGTQVLRLARLAADCGLDGVVCSAQESAMLRTALGAGFVQVTPGIRPAHSHSDDQTRIVTPQSALDQGSHYLVIGRPITAAIDPAIALQQIQASLTLSPSTRNDIS
jgi:orotidine-5'-phosphate decarboxylase